MITTSYKYDGGSEHEFVFCCRGRPFTAMVSKHLKTPTTLVDYHLVKDLGLKMTDLQCQRFTMGGYKMRIMGNISTQVQTIQDGLVNGCVQFNATVILDLYKHFDTFSVCGSKMAAKLMPDQAAVAETAGPGGAAVATPVRGPRSPQASPLPKRARPGAAQSPLRTACSPVSPVTPPRAAPSPPPTASDPVAPTATEPAMTRTPASPPSPPFNPYDRPKPRLLSSPPRSPPGFPTPGIMRVEYVPVQPRCLSLKEDYPVDQFISANLWALDDAFGAADKLSLKDERDVLAKLYPDARFTNTVDGIPMLDGHFRMETADGLRYWTGHGEYKCDRACFSVIGGGAKGVPNNCGWHRQWAFPSGFKPCDQTCAGGFCKCLENYDYDDIIIKAMRNQRKET